MLLIFICSTLLLSLCLGLFLYFRLRRNSNTTNTGNEMLTHYKTFVDLVLSECPACKLVPVKSHSLLIISKNTQGSDSLSLSKVQGKTIAVWTWTSPEFGERGKEWSFSYEHNQADMYEEIKTSRQLYQAALYQKHNLAVPVKGSGFSIS